MSMKNRRSNREEAMGNLVCLTNPRPVYTESRSCFGIAYYKTEEDAKKAHDIVMKADVRYVGGFYHDMKCGREPQRDYDGMFAVTY